MVQHSLLLLTQQHLPPTQPQQTPPNGPCLYYLNTELSTFNIKPPSRWRKTATLPSVRSPLRRLNPADSKPECLLLIPPISTCVFSFLNTPDNLCLRNTSKTMRCFVQNNPRFFRNLIFLRKGAGHWFDAIEKEYENNNNYRIQLQDMACDIAEKLGRQEWAIARMEKSTVGTIIEALEGLRDNGKHSPLEEWREQAKLIDARLTYYEKKWPVTKHFRISEFYCPKLMGRHFAQIINNMPIGRNVTSIVLDGTGVDTRWIQMIMMRFRSTLLGLSVRDCRNINTYVFADWLADSLFRHYPTPLKWLRVSTLSKRSLRSSQNCIDLGRGRPA